MDNGEGRIIENEIYFEYFFSLKYIITETTYWLLSVVNKNDLGTARNVLCHEVHNMQNCYSLHIEM